MARSKKRKPVSEINVVPYIDVMLVLLIVFMVTAPLLTQGVSVDLPKADAEPIDVKSEQENLVVSIKADGTYFIDVGDNVTQAVSLQVVTERVSKILKVKPNTQVLVRGDRKVAYGAVVELMSALQSAGAPSVGLISEPPKG